MNRCQAIINLSVTGRVCFIEKVEAQAEVKRRADAVELRIVPLLEAAERMT